ncbi:MAG: type II secretion system protein J [Syntrophobacteraceae bacterium]
MSSQTLTHIEAEESSRLRAKSIPFFGRNAPASGLDQCGFTLIEMLVSLIIGTIMVGGVMGLISVSMRQKSQINEKNQIQPVLESAAQIILADPVRATEGIVQLRELAGAPTVAVSLARVEILDRRAGEKSGQLTRVMLNYKTGRLEFSIIIPTKGN